MKCASRDYASTEEPGLAVTLRDDRLLRNNFQERAGPAGFRRTLSAPKPKYCVFVFSCCRYNGLRMKFGAQVAEHRLAAGEIYERLARFEDKRANIINVRESN